MKHRRAQIIDALYELFEPLLEPSEFPLRLKVIQRRYANWTTLDQQNVIPCLMLNFDERLRKRDGGANTEFAALGEIEEYLPIVCDVVLKESAEFPQPLTDQVSDVIYTVERLINGTPDLGIQDVYRTRVMEVSTSAGRLSALEGTPFEIVRNHIVVTHIYPANTSV